MLYGVFQPLRRSLLIEVYALQKEHVGFRVSLRSDRQLVQQFDFKRRDDGCRNFILDGENIFEFSFESV